MIELLTLILFPASRNGHNPAGRPFQQGYGSVNGKLSSLIDGLVIPSMYILLQSSRMAILSVEISPACYFLNRATKH